MICKQCLKTASASVGTSLYWESPLDPTGGLLSTRPSGQQPPQWKLLVLSVPVTLCWSHELLSSSVTTTVTTTTTTISRTRSRTTTTTNVMMTTGSTVYSTRDVQTEYILFIAECPGSRTLWGRLWLSTRGHNRETSELHVWLHVLLHEKSNSAKSIMVDIRLQGSTLISQPPFNTMYRVGQKSKPLLIYQ